MKRRKTITLAAFAITLAAIAITPASANVPPEHDPEPTVTELLELSIAKVCVNEAGFNSPGDCAMIFQAARRFYARGGVSADQRRLDWIRRHSCRVLGAQYCIRPRPCRVGHNCRWSRNLTWGDATPEEWPSRNRFPVRGWARVRAYVSRLVRGQEVSTPCEGRIITWGNASDAPGAHRRGLIPVACVGTHNTGYERIPR